MSILKIARIGHPILLKKTNEIKELGSEKIKKIVYDMSETMIDSNGIGLAAPQVHLNERLFIFRNQDDVENKEIQITAIINPVIEKVSDETNEAWEGCLSIPGMLGLVRRFAKIKYTGYDLRGSKISNIVEGLDARVIQHEFDHLEGVLYTSRLTHKDAFGYSEEIEQYWKNNENKK